MLPLNPEKRALLAHISNLIHMARLNGEVGKADKNFIMEVADTYKLTQEDFNQCYMDSDQPIIEVPESDDVKVDYMNDYVTLMTIDGHIDKKRRQFVEAICEEFGYNGKEAVDILYDELMKKNKSDSYNGADEKNHDTSLSDEEFNEELDRRLTKGAQCLMNNDMSGAFDQLLYPALADETARRLFLRIPRGVYPLFMITEKQVTELEKLAKEGYAVAQYALGRYHQLVQPDDDSMAQARDLFNAAAKGGIGEAFFATALFYRNGDFSQADLLKYFELRDEAIDKGSEKAFYMDAKDIIYGNNCYNADPQSIIDSISDLLEEATGEVDKDIFYYEPEYYDLLGRGYQELGMVDKAENAYIQAISMGYYDSLAELIFLTCYDENYQLVDKEKFDKYVKLGIQHNDAYCYTLRGDVKVEDYDLLSKREKAFKTAQIKADLEKAYALGDNIAPWALGNNYYYGRLGFEQNDQEAWNWYKKGARYCGANCYSMMVTMIDEGRCPVKTDDRFRALCLLNAYRHGDENRFDDLLEAYQNDLLDDYDDEIGIYYSMKYELEDENDDNNDADNDLDDDFEDFEEDDGKYDAWC